MPVIDTVVNMVENNHSRSVLNGWMVCRTDSTAGVRKGEEVEAAGRVLENSNIKNGM